MSARAASPTEQLVAALLAFADKRGHWPHCPQSRQIGVRHMFDKHGDEVIRPCSDRCRRAKRAIEAAGATVDQKIGSMLRADRTDDFYRTYANTIAPRRRRCILVDPERPIHQPGCRHEGVTS